MTRLLTRNETLVALILVVFVIVTGLVDPSFFSLAT